MLAVDDEAPALDELAYLLGRHPCVAQVHRAGDATSALRELNVRTIDAVFLDINMPGLSGIELAGVLANYAQPPAIVFVTAHDDKAVAAFDVGAVDYLLKPIREDRLDEAVRRVGCRQVRGPGDRPQATKPAARNRIPTSSRPSSAESPIWCPGTASAGSKPRATTPGCTRRRVRIWFGSR